MTGNNLFAVKIPQPLVFLLTAVVAFAAGAAVEPAAQPAPLESCIIRRADVKQSTGDEPSVLMGSRANLCRSRVPTPIGDRPCLMALRRVAGPYSIGFGVGRRRRLPSPLSTP